MANKTNHKFGVIHGTPSQLLDASIIEEGKLYFLSGDAVGAVKQGIYGINPLATGEHKTLTMFATGAVADGSGYGLSQDNFTTTEKNKLASLSNYILPDASNNVLGGIKTNYTQNGKNYAIKVDSNGNAYVYVPWIDKPADATHADTATNASTAEVANKLTKKLSINGIDFDGSKDISLSVKGDGKTIDVSTKDSSVEIKAITGAVSNNSNALTTGAQVADYVSTQLGNLSGALLYKGTVANATELNNKTKTSGHVWISSTKGWEYTDVNGTKYAIEVGDMFICNGTGWNIVRSEFDVSTYSEALQWGTDVSIAVVDGVTIKAKLPANPNTWRGVYVDSTSVLGSGADTSALKFVDGSNIDAYWNSTNKTIQFNHKAPTANDSSKIALSASSTTAATWGSTDLVTGITVKRDVYGHVTDVSISSIQMPSKPEDTHYTSKNVVCSSSTGTSNGAASDGSVRINHIENTTVTSSHLIDGSGTVTVTSDSNGKITITGADTNTDTKVKDASSTSKSFLLGHSSQNTTAEAQTNASCYMSGGHLYSNAKMVATIEDVDAATIYWETL